MKQKTFNIGFIKQKQKKEDNWENINSNFLVKDSIYNNSYIYDNDMYFSYTNYENLGLYYKNLITGEETKIYDDGYSWDYFADSKGNVYAYNAYGSGEVVSIFLKLNYNNTPIVFNYNVRTFYEDSKGNIYISSNSNSLALLKNDNIEIIYNVSNTFPYFYETKSGIIYAISPNRILYIKDKYVEEIYFSEISGDWKYFFEDTKGNVYASGGTGILCLNEKNVANIYEIGTQWQYFFEDSKGNVYVSSNSNSSVGILYLNGSNEVELIYEIGYCWRYFFEDSKGNVYASSSWQSNGLLYITDKEVKNIIEKFAMTNKYFESSKNNVYVLSNAAIYGIYHLNGDLVTQIVQSIFNNISEKDDSTVIVYNDNIPVSGSEYYILDGVNISNKMIII